jgi:hypothetical protein
MPLTIQIALPRGRIATALLHYERVIRICLFCVKLSHEVEQCEERTCGAWINKLYLLSRLTPDLNQVPPYTVGSGRNYEGLSADIDDDTQEQRYKRGGEQAEFAGY